jgi:branched-chain amino acid aminotransferase
MTLAEEDGLPVKEGHYSLADLRQATECFLTNTSMEVMPVSQVDGVPLGNGRPGPLTRRIQSRFAASRHRFLEPPAS